MSIVILSCNNNPTIHSAKRLKENSMSLPLQLQPAAKKRIVMENYKILCHSNCVRSNRKLVKIFKIRVYISKIHDSTSLAIKYTTKSDSHTYGNENCNNKLLEFHYYS